MCDLTAASYRHGTVIASADDSGSQKLLRVSQARRIGLAIDERLADYMGQAIACIKAAAIELGDGLGFAEPDVSYSLEKKISARFDPGLILDLPKLSVTAGGRTIELRTCLTVCVGPMKSKLWTRANTIGDWGKISPEELDQIHAFFDRMCRTINDALLSQYQVDFAREMNESISLQAFGKIHVFAADCAGGSTSTDLEQLCDNIRDRHPQLRSIENHELASAMRNVTRISLAADGQDSTGTSEFTLGGKADFYPFRGNNGAGSVFVRTTSMEDAYFSGIVNADTDRRSKHYLAPDNTSNSVGTTAEIAAFFGAAF